MIDKMKLMTFIPYAEYCIKYSGDILVELFKRHDEFRYFLNASKVEMWRSVDLVNLKSEHDNIVNGLETLKSIVDTVNNDEKHIGEFKNFYTVSDTLVNAETSVAMFKYYYYYLNKLFTEYDNVYSMLFSHLTEIEEHNTEVTEIMNSEFLDSDKIRAVINYFANLVSAYKFYTTEFTELITNYRLHEQYCNDIINQSIEDAERKPETKLKELIDDFDIKDKIEELESNLHDIECHCNEDGCHCHEHEHEHEHCHESIINHINPVTEPTEESKESVYESAECESVNEDKIITPELCSIDDNRIFGCSWK